jgi:hypothetical protein
MVKKILALLIIGLLASHAVFGAPLTADQKTKVEGQVKKFLPLGSDPFIIAAVKGYNAKAPAEGKGMTQAKWKGLSVLSNEVKFFSKNALAEYLKTKRTDAVAECFVSIADGTKAAFFSKTTSWSHKGAAKHDSPMVNKNWMGESEMDESTGKVLVQVSFPVLDAGKPIGSVVIGLDLSKF